MPPTQTVIESSHWVQYKPISSLTDQAPIEFTIPGNCEYLDLADTMLSLRVNITPTKPFEKDASVPVVEPGYLYVDVLNMDRLLLGGVKFFKDNKGRVLPKKVGLAVLELDVTAHGTIAPTCNT
ncbi:hypothetical protein TSAR_014389 [Trichomalopsis sarcophagae]|uniref:Uncharacterized protein n=1 Tax=Trichomalopsis sarcophagae TaxID=543379 RepID=A0A232EED1_9HYME|nr:hypothetical protein TSAR_014389 [Trichomalopsis sarcophagae]